MHCACMFVCVRVGYACFCFSMCICENVCIQRVCESVSSRVCACGCMYVCECVQVYARACARMICACVCFRSKHFKEKLQSRILTAVRSRHPITCMFQLNFLHLASTLGQTGSTYKSCNGTIKHASDSSAWNCDYKWENSGRGDMVEDCNREHRMMWLC